jgi:hypothetical protein
MEIFHSQDFILIPFVLAAIWMLSLLYLQNSKLPYKLKKNFLPALYLRLICGFLTAILYSYYYGYGDTFEYYKGGQIIKTSLLNGDFYVTKELLFGDTSTYSHDARKYIGEIWQFGNNSNRIVMVFSFIFDCLTFGSFLSISFIFTLLAAFGSWLIFLTFIKLNDTLSYYFKYSVLYLPSFLFWGSGIMKEPLCILGLGFAFYSSYNLIVSKEFTLKNILLCFFGVFLLFQVKVYILISFLIACIPWVITKVKLRIKDFYLRTFTYSTIIIMFITLIYIFSGFIRNSFQSFASPENILSQLDYTQSAQIINSEGGSGYDLGEIDLSSIGITKYMLAAINVSIFRPTIFEVNKLINIPMVIESTFMLFILIFTIIKLGAINMIKSILNESTILFCFIFTITLSIMVGSISFNFGTLARYRIPFMPFYFSALVLLLNKGKKITS